MTILIKTSVKTYFETGDRPNQSQFGDFIDSTLFLAETTSQTIVGGIIVSGAFQAAGSFTATGTASLLDVTASSLAITNTVSAGNVWCSSMRITERGIVSAAGTTQGTAAPLVNTVNRLQGINDGSATGFILLANKPGLVQYILNETATSANVYPCTGGNINQNGANVVFPIAGKTGYTIVHTLASAYLIK